VKEPQDTIWIFFPVRHFLLKRSVIIQPQSPPQYFIGGGVFRESHSFIAVTLLLVIFFFSKGKEKLFKKLMILRIS
jgi:hypothetical protein